MGIFFIPKFRLLEISFSVIDFSFTLFTLGVCDYFTFRGDRIFNKGDLEQFIF